MITQFIMYIVCGATQIFFMSLEIAEIQYSGFRNYFQNGWNYMDFSQIFFFVASTYLRLNQYHDEYADGETLMNEKRFYREMCSIICLIQSAFKFLQLIRYDENFCFLVQMLIEVSRDIYPFLVVFFTFCGLFSMITLILEGCYDDESYPLISEHMINIL